MPSIGAASGGNHRMSRVLRWGLALAAFAFVAWVVPLRDHCWDPQSPASTRLAVSRDAGGDGSCILHARTGAVRIDGAQCARLTCEPGVASTIRHARLGVLPVLLMLYALSSLAWAARWRALLGLTGVRLPLGDVWRVSIEAQAGGVLLPGGIGGDALRVASVVARLPRGEGVHSPVSVAVASVLLDRAVGLAVVGATAAVLAFAWGGAQAGPLANALAALPVAFVVGVIVVRVAPFHRFAWLVDSRIGRVAKPLLEYLRDTGAPRSLAVAASLSALVAGSQFATIRGLVFALGGVPVAEKWVYVGTAMAFVVSALPALPGAWGTADATYVLFFGLAGLSPGIALAVCLLYRLFWYVMAVVGAVLHIARARR
jgi:uncharacterized membrane protein YbhN (UPF0104 family)